MLCTQFEVAGATLSLPMARDARIHVRVEEERKERWERATGGESEYRDLTHLVVSAVEDKLSSPAQRGDAVEVDGEVAVDLTEFHERFDTVLERIGDIEDEVEAVSRQIEHPGESVREFIASQINSAIPRAEGTDDLPVGMEVETPKEQFTNTGLQQDLLDWANDEGWPRGIVYEALDELEQHGPVASERTDEGTIYYKPA